MDGTPTFLCLHASQLSSSGISEHRYEHLNEENNGKTYVTFIGLENLFRFLLAAPSRSSSPLVSDSEGELGDVGRFVDEALAWPLLAAWRSYSSSFVVFMMIFAVVQTVALLRNPKSRLRRDREMEK